VPQCLRRQRQRRRALIPVNRRMCSAQLVNSYSSKSKCPLHESGPRPYTNCPAELFACLSAVRECMQTHQLIFSILFQRKSPILHLLSLRSDFRCTRFRIRKVNVHVSSVWPTLRHFAWAMCGPAEILVDWCTSLLAPMHRASSAQKGNLEML
jgi:hypothetical protein